MFAPGFFTGALIKRFGVVSIIASGFALQLCAVAIALSGLGLGHFWFSMALLGVGWNFAFTGGSTLLTQVHTPSERAKTQGASNFIIFGVVAIGSLSSGALHHFFGWRWVNMGALPLIVLAALTVIWFALARRLEAGEARSG
jgi:dipeptide/tripeptide permease